MQYYCFMMSSSISIALYREIVQWSKSPPAILDQVTQTATHGHVIWIVNGWSAQNKKKRYCGISDGYFHGWIFPKYKSLHSRSCICNHRLRNGGHFVQGRLVNNHTIIIFASITHVSTVRPCTTHLSLMRLFSFLLYANTMRSMHSCGLPTRQM